MDIRQTKESDWKEIWLILHEIFAKGETYPHPSDTDERSGYNHWIASPTASYVAIMNQKIVGSYYLKPNQPGLGSHVGNAGYIVKSTARGLGVGTAMGKHSLIEAKKLGFKALQFNLVVSTNTASIKLLGKSWLFCSRHFASCLQSQRKRIRGCFCDVPAS